MRSATAGSLERDDALLDVATALRQVAGKPGPQGGDFRAARIAREYQPHLTRHFVAAYGITPARWLRLNRRA